MTDPVMPEYQQFGDATGPSPSAIPPVPAIPPQPVPPPVRDLWSDPLAHAPLPDLFTGPPVWQTDPGPFAPAAPPADAPVTPVEPTARPAPGRTPSYPAAPGGAVRVPQQKSWQPQSAPPPQQQRTPAQQPATWQPAQSAWQPNGQQSQSPAPRQIQRTPPPARKTSKGKAAAGGAAGAGAAIKALAGFKLFALVFKLKTMLTMLISIAFYAAFYGWRWAIAFVALMFVHEFGHVVALRRQGIKVGGITFLPFIGAFTTMKSQPRTVVEESLSALAGPFAGTVGATVFLIAGQAYHSPLLIAVAYAGYFINLLNLVPALPLDGGRVAGALNPYLWIAGLAGLGVWMFYMPSPILILVLIVGVIETIRRFTARRKGTDTAYMTVSPLWRRKIALMYAGLALMCTIGMVHTYVPLTHL